VDKIIILNRMNWFVYLESVIFVIVIVVARDRREADRDSRRGIASVWGFEAEQATLGTCVHA